VCLEDESLYVLGGAALDWSDGYSDYRGPDGVYSDGSDTPGSNHTAFQPYTRRKNTHGEAVHRNSQFAQSIRTRAYTVQYVYDGFVAPDDGHWGFDEFRKPIDAYMQIYSFFNI